VALDRDTMLSEFPEASQLFGYFGQDYDHEFNKDERLAVGEYIDGQSHYVGTTVGELDALLIRFPTNEAIREAVLALGVSWTMWDQDNSWLEFVQRLRGWLIEALTEDAE